MAKLQKSLKQQQRRPQSTKPQIAKLTPAEIRSLNQHATTPPQHSPSTTSHRPSGGTPPITPDHDQDRPLPRSSTVPLPTPPRSPVKQHRRESQSTSLREHHHGRKSRSSSNANPVNGYSRASSTSSYRSGQSLQTYRGHEVTQTGHKVMLQRPKQEIVSNPLSMFSRPRQSQLQATTSPDKFKRDFLELDPYQAQAMLEPGPDAPTASSRAPSPPRVTDSPVSAVEDDEAQQDASTLLDQKSEPAMSDQHVSPPAALVEQRTDSVETIKPQKAETPISTIPLSTDDTPSPANDAAMQSGEPAAVSDSLQQTTKDTDESLTAQGKPRKPARKRFSLHHAFDRKDQEKPAAVSKKVRRNTLTFTKSPEVSPQPAQEAFQPQSTGTAPEQKQELQGDDSDSIPSHPAVRPPSLRSARSSSTDSRATSSGLAPLNTSSPTYGRCACCGKIRRPHGFGTELSPVMENEHLRSNFSLEAERTSTEARRYTPIIPIAIADKDDAGSIRTVQASIEPRQPHSSATSVRTTRSIAATSYSTSTGHILSTSVSAGHIPSATHQPASESESSPVSKPAPRAVLDEPRIIRFSSLHGPRSGDAGADLDNRDGMEEIVQSIPFVQPAHRSVVPQAHTQQRDLLPSQQKLLQQQQQQQQVRHSTIPTMSGAVQRAPHPLRQSSPIDQSEEGSPELQEQDSLDGSIGEAQQKEFKRVPQQDIITVIPLKHHPSSLSASPQEQSPVESLPLVNPADSSDRASPQTQQGSTAKKLQKSTIASSPSKARRLSLPMAHKFHLPGAGRRAETIPMPYSASSAGPAPETDPAFRPPLPSQAQSVRSSMSSAAEARDARTLASASASRRTSHSQDRASAVPNGHGHGHVASQQQITGIATGTVQDSTGQQIRPSPSFARFIANLPATHASSVPEAKKFSWGRWRSPKPQGVTTIAESDGEVAATPTGSVGGRTPRAGRSRATSVSGVSESGAQPLPVQTRNGGISKSATLPQLQLGSGLMSASGTIHRLATGDAVDETKKGGFVGGVKLEQMLQRQRIVEAA